MSEASERMFLRGMLAALLLCIIGIIVLSFEGRDVTVLTTITIGILGSFAPSAIKGKAQATATAPNGATTTSVESQG